MSDLRGLLDEVEQNPMPDRWDEVRRRTPGPLPEDRRSRLPAALLGVALAIVAAVFAFQALRGGGDAAPADQSDAPVWDPTEYERTKDLTGAALFDALTKTSFRAGLGDTIEMDESPVLLNGEPVVGCPPVGAPVAQLLPIGPSSVAEDGSAEVACVGAATQDQARDIAARYAGIPLDGDPIAYEISDARVLGLFDWTDTADAGVMVRFDVGWPVELPDYPGTNRCIVSLARPSGDVVASQVFALSVGPGPVEVRVWAKDFTDPTAMDSADELTAVVACSHYTGPEPSHGELADDV